jgi:hypothetical protein
MGQVWSRGARSLPLARVRTGRASPHQFALDALERSDCLAVFGIKRRSMHLKENANLK